MNDFFRHFLVAVFSPYAVLACGVHVCIGFTEPLVIVLETIHELHGTIIWGNALCLTKFVGTSPTAPMPLSPMVLYHFIHVHCRVLGTQLSCLPAREDIWTQ